MIRKVGNNYVLYSKTKEKDGKAKRLGEFKTREQAQKREQQINYFKNKNK